MHRVCEHCGCDKHKEQTFDKLVDRESRMRRQRDDALRDAAVFRADLDLERQRHKDAEARANAKIQRQKNRINQLEKKLVENHIIPYSHIKDKPWEAGTSYGNE